MAAENLSTYEVKPILPDQRVRFDYIDVIRRKKTVWGLFEMDVTTVRAAIREHKARTGEALSFTAFIATCFAKALGEHKIMQAY